MKATGKRGLALILALVLVIGMLAGCGNRVPSKVKPEDYAKTEVASFGDQKIYLHEANLFARLQQYYSEAIYKAFFGDEFWTMEIAQDTTLEKSTKEDVMAAILQTYLLNSHAEEKGVSLTDADKEKVQKSVKDFFETSSETLLKVVPMTEEQLTPIFERNALANKVYEAVVADIDTNPRMSTARWPCSILLLRTIRTSPSPNPPKRTRKRLPKKRPRSAPRRPWSA